jgi:hypothetical protein
MTETKDNNKGNVSPPSERAMHKCAWCGQRNEIVNQCHCDPNNLPTRVPGQRDRCIARKLAAYQADLAAYTQAAELFDGIHQETRRPN